MKIALLGYGKMGKMVEECAATLHFPIVSLEEADVAIDFSHAKVVKSHVTRCAALKKNLVLGTTGWEEQCNAIKEIVVNSEIGMVYGPNFSLGVHLFRKLIEKATTLFGPFSEYDAACIELHHKEKVDAPSGTALLLKEIVEQQKPCPISSVRSGTFPGTHSFLFDSVFDTITLTHAAKSRQGFAKGALFAANWILGKKGVYAFHEI